VCACVRVLICFVFARRFRKLFDQDLFLVVVAAPLYGRCWGRTASGAETVQQPYQKNQVHCYLYTNTIPAIVEQIDFQCVKPSFVVVVIIIIIISEKTRRRIRTVGEVIVVMSFCPAWGRVISTWWTTTWLKAAEYAYLRLA